MCWALGIQRRIKLIHLTNDYWVPMCQAQCYALGIQTLKRFIHSFVYLPIQRMLTKNWRWARCCAGSQRWNSLCQPLVAHSEAGKTDSQADSCPPPGDLPHPGIEPRSPALQKDSLLSKPPGKPKNTGVGSLPLLQENFLTQELNQCLLHCRQILYQLGYPGIPMDEPRHYHTKWSKLDAERQIPYDITHKWNLKVNLFTNQTHRHSKWTHGYQMGKEAGKDKLWIWN